MLTPELEEQLRDALHEDDLPRLKAIIKEKPWILSSLARFNVAELALGILHKIPDAFQDRDAIGYTALHYAAQSGSTLTAVGMIMLLTPEQCRIKATSGATPEMCTRPSNLTILEAFGNKHDGYHSHNLALFCFAWIGRFHEQQELTKRYSFAPKYMNSNPDDKQRLFNKFEQNIQDFKIVCDELQNRIISYGDQVQEVLADLRDTANSDNPQLNTSLHALLDMIDKLGLDTCSAISPAEESNELNEPDESIVEFSCRLV